MTLTAAAVSLVAVVVACVLRMSAPNAPTVDLTLTAMAVPSTQIRDVGATVQAAVSVGAEEVIERRLVVCVDGDGVCQYAGYGRSQASGVSHGGIGRIVVPEDLEMLRATWVLYADVGLDGFARTAQYRFTQRAEEGRP